MTKPEGVPYLDLSKEFNSLKEEWFAMITEDGARGSWILGPNVHAFEKEAAEFVGTRHAIGVANGTDALYLSLRALGIGPGDEVITTPYTFFSTSEVIDMVGATPVFVDIDADPIVADGVIHVATFQGNIATIALENGRGLWNRKMSSHAGIGADKERLYVTDEDSQVWSLERRSGSSFWKNTELRARKLTAPATVDDYVVVADLEGYVHFLKRDNGAVAARIRVGSSPIVAAPIVVGNIVFISSSAGTLTALHVGG